MTTATTTTVVAMNSTAGFNAWFNEMITQLLAVGLTQTTDTGQISTGGAVSVPSANTSAGYTIWKFNDTLQSTKPVFIKLEFGAASTPSTEPQMWITVGTGSNGSGTLTGTLSTRVAVCVGNSALSSQTTAYVSRWCYSATMGFLGMAWKYGSLGQASATNGGFIVCRSTDTTGATTSDGVALLTNSNTTTGILGGNGVMQCISFATSTVYPTTLSTNGCAQFVFNPLQSTTAATTTNAGQVSVLPCFGSFPYFMIFAQICAGLVAEEPLGTTFTIALVGSTTHTYLSCAGFFGTTTTWDIGMCGGGSVGGNSIFTLCMLWE
jgi:hypothetical protein